MHPVTTPHTTGTLTRPHGQKLHWQELGNPHGTPLLGIHGGPGSHSNPRWSQLADPHHYRLILIDQRGAGASTPNAAHPHTDLTHNTTGHLISDFEALRTHLNIDRWHLLGASWGTCLALAYAQTHPHHIHSLTLLAVNTGTRREIEWITHDMRRIFPHQWEEFRAAAGPDADPRRLPAAYSRLLAHPDPTIRHDAALAWCRWEDTHIATTPDHTPNPRFNDPAFRATFARLVTHYWANDCFLEPDQLTRDLHRITHLPATLINGRLDISGPSDIAHDLAASWPGAHLVIVDNAGHTSNAHGVGQAAKDSLDRMRTL
ncbi:alpha/beta fold hydrolase [Nocardiopsis alba]|uniref:alpha/beta fold hydrolase n=1 Tax=Nocardiopsis alba TaxID=53437 RepID=UPI0035E19F4D